MNIETFRKAGIYFDACRYAAVPEIPHVQDVLYSLRLSDEQKCYDFCVNNHATYVVNVALVVTAVGYDVLCMERYDEQKARKVIAQAILDLTAPEDKCLFNNALEEAAEVVTDEPAPSRSMDRETLWRTCGCASCREIIRERQRDRARPSYERERV